MSDKNYGHCNYCGKYRPLTWNGGYCSERCYKKSGQQDQDTADEISYQMLWYYRDDLSAVIFRTIIMSIGWNIFYYSMLGILRDNSQTALVDVLTIPTPLVMIGITIVVSVIQNLMERGKSKAFRWFIQFGIPILLLIAVEIKINT